MKFITTIYCAITVLGLLTACSKSEQVAPATNAAKTNFFKEMFKGSANKKTHQDIETEVTNVIVELTKVKNQLESCYTSGKTVTTESIGLATATQPKADFCYIVDELSSLRTQPLILEFDQQQQPSILAVIGGSANEKIFGKNVILYRKGKNWQCETTVDLAYIPVVCQKHY